MVMDAEGAFPDIINVKTEFSIVFLVKVEYSWTLKEMQ